jgi:hypothetical protein
LKRLKELDELKGVKAAKAKAEKEGLLQNLYKALKVNEKPENLQEPTLIYPNEIALIHGQKTLMELGFHLLMLAGKVKLEQRHLYYNALI